MLPSLRGCFEWKGSSTVPWVIKGYILARPAELINVNEVLKILGGSLFEKSFCNDYSGILKLCTNSVDCSIRSLWQKIQVNIDQLLDNISLRDLISSETESDKMLNAIVEKNVRTFLTSGSA